MNIQLDLVEVTDAPGTLADQEGKPIAGAEVIPVRVSLPAKLSSRISLTSLLPATLVELLRATTAADGSFVIKGLPRSTQLHARVIAPDFGSPLGSWSLSEPVKHCPRRSLGPHRGTIQEVGSTSSGWRAFTKALANANDWWARVPTRLLSENPW
jgi:hypothetical protein